MHILWQFFVNLRGHQRTSDSSFRFWDIASWPPMPVAGGWNLFLRQSGCYSHFPGARNRKETESGLGPSGKVLPCPFIHKSPSPLLLHDKCLIVLWWKISLINIILSPCGTLLLLHSPYYNVIYIIWVWYQDLRPKKNLKVCDADGDQTQRS